MKRSWNLNLKKNLKKCGQKQRGLCYKFVWRCRWSCFNSTLGQWWVKMITFTRNPVRTPRWMSGWQNVSFLHLSQPPSPQWKQQGICLVKIQKCWANRIHISNPSNRGKPTVGGCKNIYEFNSKTHPEMLDCFMPQLFLFLCCRRNRRSRGISDHFFVNCFSMSFIYTLPETNSSHLKMDGWNTFSFPFGFR